VQRGLVVVGRGAGPTPALLCLAAISTLLLLLLLLLLRDRLTQRDDAVHHDLESNRGRGLQALLVQVVVHTLQRARCDGCEARWGATVCCTAAVLPHDPLFTQAPTARTLYAARK